MPAPPRKIEPLWDDDGKPVNIQAAALDAAEWIELFQSFITNKMKTPSPLVKEANEKMQACIDEIRKRVDC